MNEKKTIVLNVFATYIRSAIIFFIGLLSSRWLLQALGKTDYGLFGLVGGLTAFIAFINTLMSTAVSRYYAYAEGERQAGIPNAERKIMEWFNSALFLHVAIPTVLLIIGYPIGAYAIRHWLTIPDNRVESCIWVFRFTCLACYAGMTNVPFSGMFIAKQKIAEYTVYLTIIPVVSILYIFYIASHHGEWLVPYACFISCLTIAIKLLISIRAILSFSECRIRPSLFWDRARFRDLAYFAGWHCFGNLGALIRGQGMAILGNLFYGPEINASLTIARKVSAQTNTLSAGLKTAFAPAITNAFGAKEYDKMRRYTTETNRIGTLLIAMLALPLSLEINKIFELWLKEPPLYSQDLSLMIIGALIIDKTTSGHMLAVNASGKIALYQAVLGSFLILALPVAYIMMKLGLGVMSIGYSILITTALCAWGRVFFARKILDLSIKQWINSVLIPIGFVCIFTAGISYLPHLFMKESITRVFLTICVAEIALMTLSWFVVLSSDEKSFITSKVESYSNKFNAVFKKKK